MNIRTKIVAMLAAVIMALSMAAPANAGTYVANTVSACWTSSDIINPPKVCFKAYYRYDLDGAGIKVDNLEVTLKNTDFPTKWTAGGADGKYIKCWNNSGVLKFSLGDAQTNVGLNAPQNGYEAWSVGLDATTATSITCTYDAVAGIANEPDPEFSISLYLY